MPTGGGAAMVADSAAAVLSGGSGSSVSDAVVAELTIVRLARVGSSMFVVIEPIQVCWAARVPMVQATTFEAAVHPAVADRNAAPMTPKARSQTTRWAVQAAGVIAGPE